MKIKSILNLFSRKDISVKEKLSRTNKLYFYYKSLKYYLDRDELFEKNNAQNLQFVELIKNNEQEILTIEKTLSNKIKNFLSNKELKPKLDFIEQEDFLQIGNNFLYAREPLEGLWNTGKAIFFMPTKLNFDNELEIEFVTIPPLKIEIGFEGKKIFSKEMTMLKSEKIRFKIHKHDINNAISEFYIKTDKFWFPNLISQEYDPIPVGVGIRSIENLSA